MALRTPGSQNYPGLPRTGLDLLGHELAAEMASALGRAGLRVQRTLAELRAGETDPEQRPLLLKQAAEAVHGYFIQRELCGMRRHDAVIREYEIPKSVLARLGAR